VAQDHGVVEVGGGGAGGRAVVEDRGPPVGDDAVQRAVAQDRGGGGRVEDGAVGEGGAAAAVGVVQGHDHVDVGAVPAPGAGLLVVEEEPADLDQGVGVLLGSAAGRVAL